MSNSPAQYLTSSKFSVPGSLAKKEYAAVPDAETSTAYAEVEFITIDGEDGSGVLVTTGNRSFKNDNTCAIKSLEYASSNGARCRVELIDSEGGNFDQFYQKIIKLPKESTVGGSTGYRMRVRFGWLNSISSNNANATTIPDLTKDLYFLPLTIDARIEDGKMKFTIEGSDLGPVVKALHVKKTYGTQENPIPLKEAIKNLLKDVNVEVKFKKVAEPDSDNNDAWDFDEKIKDFWVAENKDVMSTIQDWTKNHTTKDGKGTLITYDVLDKKPTLIIWEFSGDEKDKNRDISIGQFIVNGGRHSNVISFNPQVNFISTWYAKISGGGTGATTSSKALEGDGQTSEENVPAIKAGTSVNTTVSRSSKNTEGNDAITKSSEALAKNIEANKSFEPLTGQAISSELRIIGTTSEKYLSLGNTIMSTVSIIYLNPMSISESRGESCGDWLAKSPINKTLSSPDWFVSEFNHVISDGKFVTTLNVELVGVQVDNTKSLFDNGT